MKHQANNGIATAPAALRAAQLLTLDELLLGAGTR